MASHRRVVLAKPANPSEAGQGRSRRLSEASGQLRPAWQDSSRDTHPVIVKHPTADLLQDVAGSLLERRLDVRARLRTRLDKEETLLLRPELGLLGRHLALAFWRGGCR